MLDVFPRSFCNINIAAEDTNRGKAFSGNLILRSLSREFNPDTGAFTTNTNWEAETFPELSTDGDPPPGEDCGETSCPAGYHLNAQHCCEPDGDGSGCNQTAADCAAMGEGWYLDENHCCVSSGGGGGGVGQQRTAWLAQLVTDWMGDEGTIKKGWSQMRVPYMQGDINVCKGKVTKKYIEAGEHLLDCDIWVENQQDGMVNTPGRATVALPSKKKG